MERVVLLLIITFGDEVVVDLVLHTPAMHIKKRAEDDIKKNS
jgi:ATP-binding protein involved in chromosome partitioning